MIVNFDLVRLVSLTVLLSGSALSQYSEVDCPPHNFHQDLDQRQNALIEAKSMRLDLKRLNEIEPSPELNKKIEAIAKQVDEMTLSQEKLISPPGQKEALEEIESSFQKAYGKDHKVIVLAAKSNNPNLQGSFKCIAADKEMMEQSAYIATFLDLAGSGIPYLSFQYGQYSGLLQLVKLIIEARESANLDELIDRHLNMPNSLEMMILDVTMNVTLRSARPGHASKSLTQIGLSWLHNKIFREGLTQLLNEGEESGYEERKAFLKSVDPLNAILSGRIVKRGLGSIIYRFNPAIEPKEITLEEAQLIAIMAKYQNRPQEKLNLTMGEKRGFALRIPEDKIYWPKPCKIGDSPDYDPNKPSGLPDERYIELEQTTADKCTNLVWERRDHYPHMNWKDAETYCQNLRTGNWDDWRLPDRFELESLISPDLDPYHGEAKILRSNESFWSGSRIGQTNEAYSVDFPALSMKDKVGKKKRVACVRLRF